MGLSSPNRCRKNTFSDLCQHVCITSLFHFHTFIFFPKTSTVSRMVNETRITVLLL
jgi:hypothetical protein